MKKIKTALYTLFKKLQNYPLIATIASFLYIRFNKKDVRYNIPDVQLSCEPLVGFICDEMTWQDFKGECRAIFITPGNWKSVVKGYKLDLLFCESAWTGIDAYRDSWRAQIYSSNRILFENRKALLEIVYYCKQHNIPTVFWNKEDPTFFDNPNYNFVDTAMYFDHILTTAKECVPKYKALGHASVHSLTFGFSTEHFYPPPKDSKRENTAIFAGSWYNDIPERCADLSALFDLVLESGINLIIYNRYSDSHNPVHRYPKKYLPYVRDKVSFTKLGDIFRGSYYAINCNTVKDSQTMFARRIYEIMACGCIIISNDSIALRREFPEHIWYLGEAFDHSKESEIRQANIDYVFKNHTCKKRFKEILDITGIEPADTK